MDADKEKDMDVDGEKKKDMDVENEKTRDMKVDNEKKKDIEVDNEKKEDIIEVDDEKKDRNIINIVKEVPQVQKEIINQFNETQPTVITVKANAVSHFPMSMVSEDHVVELSYQDSHPFAHGSFGVVFRAKHSSTGETIAVKKVLQDRRYKSRELEISRVTNHPNVIKLMYYFYTYGKAKGEIYLGLVYEYFPENLHTLISNKSKAQLTVPKLEMKVFSYQMFRGLAYLHSHGICHRDMKPQNILVNPTTRVIKICDFGSAKLLNNPKEKSISYICSRFYRAPELLFSATKYGVKVDVWSAGCVIAEMILLHPIFAGDNWVDQLVEIMKVLGVPTEDDIYSMNPDYGTFDFPMVLPHSWVDVFGERAGVEDVEFFQTIMKYNVDERPTTFDCLALKFFDDIRVQGARFESHEEFPPLFDFTTHELKVKPGLNNIINPAWNRPASIVSATRGHKSDPEALVLVSTPRRLKRASRFRR